MMTCPSCGQTIPDHTDVCQFCHAQLGPAAARPADQQTGHGVPQRVVNGLYMAVSIYWLVSGLAMLAYLLLARDASYFRTLGIVVSSVRAAIGLGLVLRLEPVRDIASFVCFVFIAVGFGVFGFWPLFVPGLVQHLMFSEGFPLLLSVLDDLLLIVTSGAMIWLIGETRKRALG